MKKKLFIFASGLLLIKVFTAGVVAEEKPFEVGIFIGSFNPQNHQIQGQQTIYYGSYGEARNVIVSGFGEGNDLILYGSYFFSSWGLRLESGVRLLLNRKIDVTLTFAREYFEHRLIIVPISLSLIQRIKITDSKFNPYLGIGPEINFVEWEQKHFTYYGTLFERTWLKGDMIPIGIHFLAGLNFPIYHNLHLGGELKYCYVEGDLTLKNVDTDQKTKLYNLNLGGTSLRFGLNYRF